MSILNQRIDIVALSDGPVTIGVYSGDACQDRSLTASLIGYVVSSCYERNLAVSCALPRDSDDAMIEGFVTSEFEADLLRSGYAPMFISSDQEHLLGVVEGLARDWCQQNNVDLPVYTSDMVAQDHENVLAFI